MLYNFDRNLTHLQTSRKAAYGTQKCCTVLPPFLTAFKFDGRGLRIWNQHNSKEHHNQKDLKSVVLVEGGLHSVERFSIRVKVKGNYYKS